MPREKRISIRDIIVDLFITDTTTASITASVLRRRFEWIVTNRSDIVDIVPVIDSFHGLVDYDHYAVAERLCAADSYDLTKIAEILVLDLLHQQDKCIVEFASRAADKMNFNINMLKAVEGASVLLVTDDDNAEYVECQLPLLRSPTTDSSLEYLYELTRNQPIMVLMELRSRHLSHSVQFPQTMTISRKLDLSKKKKKKSDDIIELISLLENTFRTSWLRRKVFVEELQRLASVLEYDSIDFSYVLIAVRVKNDTMYTVCNVEFRLAESFPSTAPLISVHDLQTNFSTPIATSKVVINESFAVERIARELLLLAASEISLQAFGSNVLV